MCLRCEFSGALFVMQHGIITDFMAGWRFRFLRSRMFFRFLAFVQRNFVQDFSVFPLFSCTGSACIFAFSFYTCAHVRVHTPARNT